MCGAKVQMCAVKILLFAQYGGKLCWCGCLPIRERESCSNGNESANLIVAVALGRVENGENTVPKVLN